MPVPTDSSLPGHPVAPQLDAVAADAPTDCTDWTDDWTDEEIMTCEASYPAGTGSC